MSDTTSPPPGAPGLGPVPAQSSAPWQPGGRGGRGGHGGRFSGGFVSGTASPPQPLAGTPVLGPVLLQPSTPWQPVGLVDPGDVSGANADADAGAGLGAEVPASPLSALDWFSTSKTLARGVMNWEGRSATSPLGAAAILGLMGAETGISPEPETAPMVQPEQANAEGKAVGLSKFTQAVPRDVLNSMVSEAQDAQQRAEIASHIPGGMASVVHGVANFAAQLLDPVNVAAAFIPIGGEGMIASGLARAGIEDAGATLAGRTAMRAGAGAITGAAGMVPVTAALALADASNQQDMTGADALNQVLSGAAFGGVLHPLAGAVGDAWRAAFGASPAGKLVADDPALRRDAASAAIAATVEDRPVDVHDFIELSAREQAQARALRSLQYDESAPVAARLNALEDDMTRPGVPEALADNLEQQHAALSDIAASTQDLEQVGSPSDADAATAARVASVEDELTQPGALTSRRQAELLAEHGMLTEGAQPEAPEEAELRQARDEAQRQGNQIAIARNNDRINNLQAQIRASATVQRALGGGDPEAVAASRAATSVAESHKPPGPTPVVPADMAEIEQMVAGMRERGHLGPEGEAEMSRIDANGAEYENFAKAMESLGSCMGSAV